MRQAQPPDCTQAAHQGVIRATGLIDQALAFADAAVRDGAAATAGSSATRTAATTSPSAGAERTTARSPHRSATKAGRTGCPIRPIPTTPIAISQPAMALQAAGYVARIAWRRLASQPI